MTHPLLQVRELTYRFESRRRWGGGEERGAAAVHEVGFTIDRGEILGLAGESGSGKSTLARLLAGLLAPQRGEIHLDGLPVGSRPNDRSKDARRRIQLIFQDPSAALSPRRTIGQSLLEPLAHFGICDARDRHHRINQALGAVGLEPSALERLPHHFSTGQRQRLSIARALLAEPDLLIADEPVSALDVSVQAAMLDLLRRLRESHGISMLFISHDLAVVKQLADRVTIMLDGRLVESGPVEAIFSHAAHPYTQRLLNAVLDPDPSARQLTEAVVASLGRADAASGCSFSSRCHRALPPCHEISPPEAVRDADGQHRVKCHLYPNDGNGGS